MNPEPTLDSLGLPHEMDAATIEDAWKPFMEKVGEKTAAEMQTLASDKYRQAGTICWTTDEFKASEHGKANAHVGFYELHELPNSTQKACWWPDSPETSARRPLAGLKVVDLTRVIAAPAVTRGLAELGASVMRITSPNLTDFSGLHLDLNWGKWNGQLDFKKEEDREKMRQLILEADVVVQGYRPDVLNKYGFGQEGIMKLVEKRGTGIIMAFENCYGWNGPWSYRSGWQQISDAVSHPCNVASECRSFMLTSKQCCGVSMEFGRAMGNDEAVTPVFPNSDYCTGVGGVVGVINALIDRSEKGGSYRVDVALNYYSQWLVNSCGTYSPSVWNDVWTRNGRKVFRHYHNMLYLLPEYFKMLKQHSADVIFKPEFFEDRECKVIGKDVRTVKPILKFPQGKVELKYNVGTRTNGIDQPHWPKDLMTEIVN
jgi:CoA-transferase family III